MRTPRPVVLVTGGVRRSGFVIAGAFAGAGYDVGVQYLTSGEDSSQAIAALSAPGATVHAYRADLEQPADLARLVDRVHDDFGRLDVLVNNASVFFQDHLADFELDAFDRAWRVNCRAPILLTRAFHDRARADRRTGVVINIVDQKVKDNFQRDHFSYTVAKNALGTLTQMLAVSCAPVLRVNAIFPGLLLPSDDQTQEDFEYAARKSTLLGYAASPADVGAAAVELADPRYNGSDLIVDAGQNLIPVDQDVIYRYRSPRARAKAG